VSECVFGEKEVGRRIGLIYRRMSEVWLNSAGFVVEKRHKYPRISF